MFKLTTQTDFVQKKYLKQVLFLSLFSVSLLGTPSCASPLSSPPKATLVRQSNHSRNAIDQVITQAMQEQKLVGLALGLVEQGQITYLKGYGWADQEDKVAVTEQSSFRWASISKPVTSVLSMQLVEQGKLNLDSDIRSYWPEYRNAQGWPVTQRQLLSHLGGVGSYDDVPNWQTRLQEYQQARPTTEPPNMVQAAHIFAFAPLMTLPGTEYRYSTFGAMLAGAVLSKASGQSYLQQFEERIRQPLKLTSTRPDIQSQFIPYRVSGYALHNGQISKQAAQDVSWKLPGGGFTSNVADLTRFMQALINQELINQKSETEMWTSQQTSSGKKTGYGLSFGLSELYQQRRVEHFGAQQNTRTAMSFLPDQKLGLVIMCNSEWANLAPIRDQLYAVLQQGKHPWSQPETK